MKSFELTDSITLCKFELALYCYRESYGSSTSEACRICPQAEHMSSVFGPLSFRLHSNQLTNSFFKLTFEVSG